MRGSNSALVCDWPRTGVKPNLNSSPAADRPAKAEEIAAKGRRIAYRRLIIGSGPRARTRDGGARNVSANPRSCQLPRAPAERRPDGDAASAPPTKALAFDYLPAPPGKMLKSTQAPTSPYGVPTRVASIWHGPGSAGIRTVNPRFTFPSAGTAASILCSPTGLPSLSRRNRTVPRSEEHMSELQSPCNLV